MRHFRVLGGVALAALLICAALASGASAAVPELGRCTKVEKVQEGKKSRYNGAYSNKGCTHLNRNHRGKYEWTPGPGAENHFSGIANEPEPVLETTGGTKISCAELELHGEYTGAKSAKISKFVLAGCEVGSGGLTVTCETNPAKEGELEATELEAELGMVKSTPKPVAGWDIKKSGGGAIYTFVCANKAELPVAEGTIEGSVIANVVKGFFEGDINKVSIYSGWSFKQSGGHQEPESFEGAAKDTLSEMTVQGLNTKTEQLGLSAPELETVSGLGEPIEKSENQEPLEIKTK